MDVKSASNLFSGPALVIVTGANRGFGLQIAIEAVAHLHQGSTLVVVGRNQQGLENAVNKIESAVKNNAVQVKVVLADLADGQDTCRVVDESLKDVDITKFKSAAIFHNAATLGDVSLTLEQTTDPEKIKQYFDLNVSNCFLLTSKFLSAFSQSNTRLFVINISSICAFQPWVGYGLYCTAKAARNMMFKVLCAEESDVRVLNYAPGPMPTEMLTEACRVIDKDHAARNKKMLEDKTYVKCSDSAKKLFSILKKNDFESGAHIDIFDS